MSVLRPLEIMLLSRRELGAVTVATATAALFGTNVGEAWAANPPYFQAAAWLWTPIPSNPVLDPQSSAMGSLLAQGTHLANLWDFGVTLRAPQGITTNTPRYHVAFDQVPAWGPDPFSTDPMPIPDGTAVPPGSDGQVATADAARNLCFNLWQARASGSGVAASWGSKVPLNGDGRELYGSSSTGSRIARFAAVIRAAEIAAGTIPHALFFSTDMAAPASVFRYPAAGSDGRNMAGVADPLPEGARVQLDPSVNLAAIAGITRLELIVGRALQTYGAYCGDNGGARMAFIFEYEGGQYPGQTYQAAGAGWDYFDMPRIPWDRLRVLANSTGF